jgi:Tfp pilus assembly protein PilF
MSLPERVAETAPPRDSGRSASRSRGPAALLALLVLCTSAAYSNTLAVPFVMDDQLLADRVELHASSLSPGQLARAAPNFPLGRWLAYVTFAANHALHGLRPAGYHLTNLAIHLVAAILFWRVSLRLLARLGGLDEGRRRLASGIAALLFALHPVQTMAVTYVIQRMASLGTALALAALLVWLRWRDAQAPRGALGPLTFLGLWFLAFSCKESFVVLPLALLLVEWLSGADLAGAFRRRPTMAVALGLAAGATVVVLAFLYAPVIRNEAVKYGDPIGQRLMTQPRVLWHYLSLLALPLPSRLHFDYAWPASTGLFTPPTTFLSLAGLVFLVVGAWRLRRRLPVLTFAVGWFLIALLVEQTFLPIDLVFEQRLYFAALGFFLAAGWGLASLPHAPALPAALAGVAVLSLGLGTHARNQIWNDPARLLSDGGSGGAQRARGLLNAATHRRQAGDLDGAEKLLTQALALDPREPRVLANLGHVAQRRGQLTLAEQRYRAAAAAAPGDGGILYNLGTVLEQAGRLPEARDAYGAALAAQPGLTDARVNLALLLAREGLKGEALLALDLAIERDQGSTLALMNRALLRAEVGRAVEAEADARRAIALVPDDANAHFVLGRALAAQGRTKEALAASQEALRRDPANADARSLLAELQGKAH